MKATALGQRELKAKLATIKLWMQPSLNEALCGFNYPQIISPLNDPSID